MNDLSDSEGAVTLPPPCLVPRETPAGIRYVRPPGVRRSGLSLLLRLELSGFAVLAVAAAVAAYTLALGGPVLPAWQVALALLYPLQLALDMAAAGRSIAWSLGYPEIELAEGRLRAGLRWGPFWLGARSMPAGSLRRLVIVRRPSAPFAGVDWDLAAEADDGPPLTLLSAYEAPELIRPIAQDLHYRLGASAAPPGDWPPLVEEDAPPAPPSTHPRPRPLIPGGAYGWFVVHIVGSVGLWYVGIAAAQIPQRAPWHTGTLAAAVLLQMFLFLFNVAFLKASRESART